MICTAAAEAAAARTATPTKGTRPMTASRPRSILRARASLIGAVRNMICAAAFAAGVDPIGLADALAGWWREQPRRQAALHGERPRRA